MEGLTKINVVLVHTGKEFFPYINDNIYNLVNYGFAVHIILPRDQAHQIIYPPSTVQDSLNIQFEEDFISEDYKAYMASSPHDPSFRDAFFTRASSRFFLLAEFARKTGMKHFFHIENDVLLYDNFVNIRELFLAFPSYQMACVIDAPQRCIPSVVYFHDYQIIEQLCHFIRRYKHNYDMMNLFHFFIENMGSKVINFPILPEYDLSQNSAVIKIDYANFFSEFGGVFDGAAIGQYLGGVDPRNIPGDTRGFINETTIFKCSDYTFEWIDKKPFMVTPAGEKIKIFNLHIHSKELSKFIFT